MSREAEGLAVGVVGASGYSGGELCRLLLGHPQVSVVYPSSRQAGVLEHIHPNLAGCGLELRSVEQLLDEVERLDVLFICAPAGEAMHLVPEVLEKGVRVIDLGADFRFADAGLYERTYGQAHACPELLAEAVHGITELNREQIREARLIANPGCYVISIVLAISPLIGAGLLEPGRTIHASAVNGSTGAGRTPRGAVMHAEMFGSMLPYSMEGHRHGPEIEARLGDQGLVADVCLATAHGNFARGIYATASLVPPGARGDELSRESLTEVLVDFYGRGHEGEHFVIVKEQSAGGGLNEKSYELYPSVGSVTGSNFCHLGIDYDRRTGTVKAMSVIDNLGKGAAGSAVQNMNVMLGLAETAGIGQYGL
ncbi:MAG: N-acetyl-gamma-glutamyl-phosphate reductase [Solirubrobacterales bacterium]